MFCALAWGRATTHTDRTKRVDRPDPDRTNETYFAYVIVRSRERANLRSITFPRNRSQTHDSIESSRPIKVAQLPHDSLHEIKTPTLQGGSGGTKRSFPDRGDRLDPKWRRRSLSKDQEQCMQISCRNVELLFQTYLTDNRRTTLLT